MRRRTVLRTAAVGLVAAFAGCGESVEPSPTPDGDDYEKVVDLVEEGADPTGEESILPLLESHAADDTLLYLSDGKFRIDSRFRLESVSNFGLVGDRASIVPERGFQDILLFIEATNDLRLEGLHFDLTDESTAGRMLQVRAEDALVVRDVSISGRLDGGPSPVRLDVTGADGTGHVERLSLPDGATVESEFPGVYVGNTNAGDITFLDCHIEGFPDNGLYADPPDGRMEVVGGYYANSGISNVRVNDGSTIRGVHIRCDDARDGLPNMRGIRATDYESNPDSDPVVVENCRIEILDVTDSDGAVVLEPALASLVVRDTYIRVDADGVNAVRAKVPNSVIRDGHREPSVHLENLTVYGTASRGVAIRIDERSGNVLKNVYVHQSGLDRDGIEFRRSNDNVVVDSVLDVTGRPVVLADATAETEYTTSNVGRGIR